MRSTPSRSSKYYDKIGLPKDSAKRKSVTIRNPLGEDTSVMRTTALPSILEVLARNANFSNEKVGLYELATTYTPTGEDTRRAQGADHRLLRQRRLLHVEVDL